MQILQKLEHWIEKNTISNAFLWVIFILWSLFVSNLWLPRNWGFYGHHDWDLTYSTFEAARKCIVEFHQFPTYNPYSSFGTDFWSNPQSVHLSMYLIPVLLFGTFYGYKVSIIAGILIGLWGSYKLFFTFNKQASTSVVLSFLFVGSAYFSRHVFEAGHSNVLFYYLLPYSLLFFHQIIHKKNLWSYIKFTLILVQIIIGGAPFVFISIAILLGLWIIGISISQKQFKLNYAFIFISTMLLSIGLSMFKLYPVIQHWSDYPRLVKEDSGISLLTWFQSLADFNTDTRTWHDWFEFSLGINLSLFVLFIYFFKQLNHGKLWLIMAIPLVWICLGNSPNIVNPWYFLNEYVPVFKSLRAPYRFGILVVFSFYLALSFILKNTQHIKWVNLLLFVVLLSQTLHYNSVSKCMVNGPRIEEKQISMLDKNQPKPKVLSQKDYRNQFRYVKANYMVLNAYEPMQLHSVHDTLNQLVTGAKVIKFLPNYLKLELIDSISFINYRYSSNWKIKSGKAMLKEDNGLTKVLKNDHTIELQYTNNEVKVGVFYTLIALILLVITFFVYKIKYQI